MNRMQIGLKLAMDIIGIPVHLNNYREICDAVYHAEQVGVHISPSRVEWDWQKMRAWSPPTHESGSSPLSSDLREDVYTIQIDVQGSLECGEKDDSFGYTMDEPSAEKLRNLYQKAPEVYRPLRFSPSSFPLSI